VTIFVSQLLQMARNMVCFVQAQFNLIPALSLAKNNQVASGSLKEPSSPSIEAVDAAAIDVDR
jgi:hypothetical protein